MRVTAQFIKFMLYLIIALFCFVATICAQQTDKIDLPGRPALRIYNDRDGLPQNSILCMAFDGKGYLWIGTQDGAAFYNGRAWHTVNMPNPSRSNYVCALLVSADQSIWFGTNGNGLARLKDGQWTTYDTNQGLPNNKVRCLLETSESNGDHALWIGTDNGLAQFHNGALKIYTTANGLPHNTIYSLLETVAANGARTLWAGTNGGGLARYENNQWTTIDNSNGLPSNWVNALLETESNDGTRELWVGTEGGLARYQHGQWTSFDTGSGLPNNLVRSLCEIKLPNGKRTLWVGTSGGVAWFDLNSNKIEWQSLSDRSDPPLPNNTIYQIRTDALGHIYLSTNKGVARLVWQKQATASAPFAIYTFTIEDGLPSNECDQGAAMVDSDGRIWVGTVAGAARFNPAGEAEDQSTKPLYIERAMVAGENRSLLPNNSLTYRESNIIFEYALLSFFREGDTRYQTQLFGYDNKPSQWTVSTLKEYTNLPAGEYTFQVWGRDYLGNITGPVAMRFHIYPAPWRTWWAYSIYFLLSLGLIYSGYSWRVQRLKRRQEERIKYLSHLQQLNEMKSCFLAVTSHEMRTPLTVLKGSLEALLDGCFGELRDSQQRRVSTCHRMTDRLIDGLNDITEMLKISERRVVLKPVVFNLPQLIEQIFEELATVTEQRRQELIMDNAQPIELTADIEKVRLLLLNLIQNAIKFTPDEGKITVRFLMQQEAVEIVVEDNGIGIDSNDLAHIFEIFYTSRDFSNHSSGKFQFQARGAGLGLAIAKSYAEAHGGHIWAESAGKGCGSKFHVILPFTTTARPVALFNNQIPVIRSDR